MAGVNPGQHGLNGLHVYCRLKDLGFPRETARRLAAKWENFINPWIYRGHDMNFLSSKTFLGLLTVFVSSALGLLRALGLPIPASVDPAVNQVLVNGVGLYLLITGHQEALYAQPPAKAPETAPDSGPETGQAGFVRLWVLGLILALALTAGCAGTSSTNTPAQNAQVVALDASEASKQLAGATTAIATLTPQLPDQAAAGQINNYLAWANVAAQALGIVAQAVAPVL